MEDFDRRRNTAAAVAETVSGKGGGKENPLPGTGRRDERTDPGRRIAGKGSGFL